MFDTLPYQNPKSKQWASMQNRVDITVAVLKTFASCKFWLDYYAFNPMDKSTAMNDTPYQVELNASATRLIGDSSSHLDRLPTLYEVLNRKTQAPVDLWSFYVYMRDSQQAIDYLDFWIDCVQHLNLCKNYVKGLRRSLHVNDRIRNAPQVAEIAIQRLHGPSTESLGISADPLKRDTMKSVDSSVLLDLINQQELLGEDDSHRLSAFLRGEGKVQTNDPAVINRIEELKRRSESTSGDFNFSQFDTQQETKARNRVSTINPEMLEYLIEEEDKNGMVGPNGKNQFVTRLTLRKSSQKLINTYFANNSDKRIVIPDHIVNRVLRYVEQEGRDDPEVFDEPRNFVFRAMENEAFPGFLSSHAISNVTSMSSAVRFFLSIFFAFVGFWVGYVLIFLDWHPKPQRAVVVVPFFLASYLMLSSLYFLDPFLVFLGYSESKAAHKGFIPIREPFVAKLLRSRAIWVLFLICIVAAALSVVFALVPGRRL
ncbi:unnamed protein product [Kuraishia capsulata CBS 1993]|uniref:RGS domain-containing protein n=1 Tax=Kuraishia capsulata CBS 1993 TaxID=1382522 RepID=W6MRW4_9ASCO|nr:uncharacterized protein KUCA_T00005105001 [Kuraishia capsulata CBS 1993]CDK29118.1 unnamed protein product [Kuraishia capsulata CBS 1993]